MARRRSEADGPLDDGQIELIERNLRLALSIARGFCQDRRLHIDDRVDAAIQGLVAAARKYDPARGPFPNYAGRAIRRALIAEMRARTPIRIPRWIRTTRTNPDSPSRAAAAVASRAADVGDLPPRLHPRIDDDPAAEAESAELRGRLAGLVPMLPDAERSIVEATLRGDSFAAIGRELGYCRERPRQLYRAALARLRDGMTDG